MSAVKQLKRAVVLAATAGVAAGFAAAAPAQATPAPPNAASSLSGTWLNTNAASRNVKQVIVTPVRGGTVAVDAFGSCSPSWCEWGWVRALNYAPNVSSTTGTSFQTNQAFLSGKTEWSRTQLQGTVRRTAAGLRLTVRELTEFEDGSGRKNYTVTETFKPGRAAKMTKAGHLATTFPTGNSPQLVAGALGSWTNLASTGGLVKLSVAGTQSAPVVEAFGQCSPTPCDWGRAMPAVYGSSISSAVGTTALAPYSFGFKNAQLVIKYWLTASGDERLTVTTYNEFTDSSGRSNYVLSDTFARS